MKKITLLASFILALLTTSYAADIVVDPSITTLSAAYTAAQGGDVLILMDGTYTFTSNFTMTKAITFKSQNVLGATIQGATFAFTTNSTGNVTFKDLVIDGTRATNASYVVDFTASAYPLAVNKIVFENCTVKNYGNCFLRANRGECTCEGFTINKCTIKDCGSAAAYPLFQVAKTKFGNSSLEFTNNTVVNFANEYIQTYSVTPAADNSATYLFNNNTFYKTATNSARNPFQFSSGIVKIQNNIFALSATDNVRTSDVMINAAIASAEFTNNNVYSYGAGDLFTFTWSPTAGTTTVSGNIDSNPNFSDPDNGNFTLPVGSAAALANMGDPRWNPNAPSSVNHVIIDSNTLVSIYTVEGKMLRKNVLFKDVVNQLKNGIYIVNNKKLVISR